MGRIHKFKRNFKPKKKYWARKKRWIRKVMGESSGSGPNEVEAPPAPERPWVVENLTQREVVSNEQLGLMVVIGGLDRLRRIPAMGSPSKTTSGVWSRAIEDLEAPGPLKSASEGMCRASGGIFGGLGKLVEGMGLAEEEGCTSYVEEIEECLSPVDGAGVDEMMALKRKQGELGEFVEGLRLPVELKTAFANWLGRIGAVEVGPKSEPKMKEAKPKMKRVLSLGRDPVQFLRGRR